MFQNLSRISIMAGLNSRLKSIDCNTFIVQWSPYNCEIGRRLFSLNFQANILLVPPHHCEIKTFGTKASADKTLKNNNLYKPFYFNRTLGIVRFKV